jgi:hypothetical protein
VRTLAKDKFFAQQMVLTEDRTELWLRMTLKLTLPSNPSRRRQKAMPEHGKELSKRDESSKLINATTRVQESGRCDYPKLTILGPLIDCRLIDG